MAVAINCDMGEAFGLYRMGDDAAIMPLITVANVACGFHASDPVVMHKTVRLAKQHGVKVGAHPSLPDLQGFGRREMKIPRAELTDIIIYQVGALKGFLDAEGMALNHIKPHGVLYGMAARQEEVAHAVCDAADVFGVPLFGMAGTLHEKVYTARGHPLRVGVLCRSRLRRERRADHHPRAPCGRSESWRPSAACARSRTGKVKSTAGNDVPVRAESVCVHSDTPNAVEIAEAVQRGAGALHRPCRLSMNRVLIANRGEIACRVIRSCQALGLETVAVYSEADASALHVELADGAEPIGPPPARQSYLEHRRRARGGESRAGGRGPSGLRLSRREPALRRAGHRRGPDLDRPAAEDHRGHGRQGAGPSAGQGRGRAGAARQPALRARAISPASRRRRSASATRSWSRRRPAAAASACSGSTGRRSSRRGRIRPRRWPSARSATARSISSASCAKARHVEIQVFGFGDGHAVHLFERECSIQRRFQKIIEETPAPGLAGETRRA